MLLALLSFAAGSTTTEEGRRRPASSTTAAIRKGGWSENAPRVRRHFSPGNVGQERQERQRRRTGRHGLLSSAGLGATRNRPNPLQILVGQSPIFRSSRRYALGASRGGAYLDDLRPPQEQQGSNGGGEEGEGGGDENGDIDDQIASNAAADEEELTRRDGASSSALASSVPVDEVAGGDLERETSEAGAGVTDGDGDDESAEAAIPREQEETATTASGGGAAAGGRDFVASTKRTDNRDRPFLRRFGLKRRAQALGKQLDQLKNKVGGGGGDGSDGGTAGSGGKGPVRRLMGSLLLGQSLAAVFANKKGAGISFVTLYALSLLGSSVGFYLFLYFISVGYALGIFLPLFAAVVRAQLSSSSSNLTLGTKLHSALVLLWGARSTAFFLWREYVSWPALHFKVVEVNKVRSPPLSVKLICWLVYSFLYLCMLSPCWFRLERDVTTITSSAAGSGGTVGRSEQSGGKLVGAASRLGLFLQASGLALETVADWQKSSFKASQNLATGQSQRSQWCHTGVWKFSTNPNYFGEWLFWVGTHLGGLQAIDGNPIRFLMMATGLVFITLVLRAATVYLSDQHYQKYADIPEFVHFQQNHGVAGPKYFKMLQARFHALRQPAAAAETQEGQTMPDPAAAE